MIRFCYLCDFMCVVFFFFKQKTAYEMRISDWSSDVCSSDLLAPGVIGPEPARFGRGVLSLRRRRCALHATGPPCRFAPAAFYWGSGRPLRFLDRKSVV